MSETKCIQCGAKSDGKTRCVKCAARAAETRKARNEKRKAAGICTVCGDPAKPGKTMCQKDIDKRSEVSTKRYYAHKAAGTCRDCGKDAGGRSRCDACRERMKKSQAGWYQRRKEAKICLFCDKPAVTETLCEQHREEHRLYSQARWAEMRQKVLDHYGHECAECGEDDEELLQVDHKNGEGNEHRREIGQSNLYLWLIQNGFPEEFQILCAGCNWKKH